MSKKKYLLSLLVLIILTAGILAFNITSNFAQNITPEQSIEISPPSQELDVDPGQTITLKAKARNKGNIPYTLTTRIEDFTAEGEGGQVALVEQGPWAISSWSTISPATFTLEPKSEREVQVTIKVPDQKVGGGRYGAMVFSINGGTTPNSAAIAQEIASLFLLRVSGPVDENIKVLEFSAPSFVEFGPVPLTLRLQNGGNVHVKATGIVSIMNVLGKKVEDIVIPPTNVFPDAARVIDTSFNQKFLIGPYQAVAIVYYGSENKSITTYTPFFAFPVKIVAGIIILIVIILLIRKYLRRNKRTANK
ncbi:DUF916 domain-containing protein [Candidatus Roizmanbacteria bacterium]|nr:MAG: DUF916 domain-containing protein [Candidatus Roizmanbacteria bacterium]